MALYTGQSMIFAARSTRFAGVGVSARAGDVVRLFFLLQLLLIDE